MTDYGMIKYLRTKGLGNGASSGSHSGTMDLIADRFIELLAENNRQQAEIERLKLITTKNPYCVRIGTADIFIASHEEYEKLLAKIQSEAVKEFAERLKESKRQYEGTLAGRTFTMTELDNLVKEMVGEAE